MSAAVIIVAVWYIHEAKRPHAYTREDDIYRVVRDISGESRGERMTKLDAYRLILAMLQRDLGYLSVMGKDIANGPTIPLDLRQRYQDLKAAIAIMQADIDELRKGDIMDTNERINKMLDEAIATNADSLRMTDNIKAKLDFLIVDNVEATNEWLASIDGRLKSLNNMVGFFVVLAVLAIIIQVLF
jgi:hypothetical protein